MVISTLMATSIATLVLATGGTFRKRRPHPPSDRTSQKLAPDVRLTSSAMDFQTPWSRSPEKPTLTSTRTDQRTVTFTKPFQIQGIEGIQPPGSYRVDTDEESIDDLSFLAWRRLATTFHIHRNGLTQVFRVDPTDLAASLLRDSGQTIPTA